MSRLLTKHQRSIGGDNGIHKRSLPEGDVVRLVIGVEFVFALEHAAVLVLPVRHAALGVLRRVESVGCLGLKKENS